MHRADFITPEAVLKGQGDKSIKSNYGSQAPVKSSKAGILFHKMISFATGDTEPVGGVLAIRIALAAIG